MNEPQFGSKIRHLLSQGAPLDASILAKLRDAREAALARQKPESAQSVTWMGGILGRMGGLGGLSLRLIVPVLALAIGFAAVYTWEQRQRAAEVEELDALVLTGELPIDAYLDRGFEAWLKKRASY
ncbi:MAG TPA: DUF3619 family protein [Burkholderiales bacterium]